MHLESLSRCFFMNKMNKKYLSNFILLILKTVTNLYLNFYNSFKSYIRTTKNFNYYEGCLKGQENESIIKKDLEKGRLLKWGQLD